MLLEVTDPAENGGKGTQAPFREKSIDFSIISQTTGQLLIVLSAVKESEQRNRQVLGGCGSGQL